VSELVKAEACNYVRPGRDLQTQAAQSFNTDDDATLATPSPAFSYGMLTTLCTVYAKLYGCKRHHTYCFKMCNCVSRPTAFVTAVVFVVASSYSLFSINSDIS
jgi:hypothetical protein